MTGFQIAVARETLSLARRVFAGEQFTHRERQMIARMIWQTLRHRESDESLTPEMQSLRDAYWVLRDLEASEKANRVVKVMSAGGGR